MQALNFFIVHKNSPHLDEQYTVFGRIITQESYDTLDNIANLAVTSESIPFKSAEAEIRKTEIVTRSNLANILTLDAPERVETSIIRDISRYSNAEYGFSFMPQAGWMLQKGDVGPGNPVLMALGVANDGITPSIIFEALESNDATLEEYFEPRLESYHELDDGITFDILSEEYFTTYAGYVGLEITAVLQNFQIHQETPLD